MWFDNLFFNFNKKENNNKFRITFKKYQKQKKAAKTSKNSFKTSWSPKKNFDDTINK